MSIARIRDVVFKRKIVRTKRKLVFKPGDRERIEALEQLLGAPATEALFRVSAVNWEYPSSPLLARWHAVNEEDLARLVESEDDLEVIDRARHAANRQGLDDRLTLLNARRREILRSP